MRLAGPHFAGFTVKDANPPELIIEAIGTVEQALTGIVDLDLPSGDHRASLDLEQVVGSTTMIEQITSSMTMVWSFDEVLLVRHGETEWNMLGRRHGQLDSALTERGRRQARVIASLASSTEAGAVYSSPLGRARATAEPISLELGRPVRFLPSLSEVHHGEFAGLTSKEIEEQWPGVLVRREQQKFDWRFPGGESYRDAADRVTLALDEMDTYSSKRPIVVAHEMIGRMVIGRLLELPPDEALRWTLPHGTILRIDPNGRQTYLLAPAK